MCQRKKNKWLDGAEVSASGWWSGGPRFQSHSRLTFQSCSRYQLNQLGSEAASESTFKKSNTCGVSNTKLYFFTFFISWLRPKKLVKKEDGLNNIRSLTFAKNIIEKKVKKRVLFKNYKERFERSLHLCYITSHNYDIIQYFIALEQSAYCLYVSKL